ncbi:hypothetical protein A9A72_122479 [Stutzerimonas stutzeri]|uniref:Uncharacterized protein n=1 Tax=Stutzerimonas stutzeri TaxID=316 RepID=A0A5S5BE77_STUST|nr:hypothetical protein A9A72_122479 [Stutzerimonas stutzeri]
MLSSAASPAVLSKLWAILTISFSALIVVVGTFDLGNVSSTLQYAIGI